MTFDEIAALAAGAGLTLTGWFHPEPAHKAPASARTMLLFGYGGQEMWARFRTAPEFHDGERDPLDRWSARLVEAIAAQCGGTALFPFGGPPYQPFIRWIYAGEPVHPSRLGMAIHPDRGLWSSWRGALALTERLDLPPVSAAPPPCEGCAMPCRPACPVGAFGDNSYDAADCRAHLYSPQGRACTTGGCLARRACPVGDKYAQCAEQATFHLEAFRSA